MTSRNSFFNLLKEDLHRRLWTLILSSLVFFATFVVAFTMVIQNFVGRYSRASYGYTNAQFIERMSDNLCEEFYGFWPWFLLVAIVGAIICGMNGFDYLHSRKQMDFYHSLPIKREKIFAVRMVNGILIYAVPYLVGLLYTYLMCAIYRVMTWDIFFCSLFMFMVHFMGYLIMYLGVILAMMLTGKIVIGFFGICAINLYAPAVYALIMWLKEAFFITSYNSSVQLEDALRVTRFLSPGSYYGNLIVEIFEEETTKGFWVELLLFLLLAGALLALNLWLYKKRASEKADTAMAFKVTEPVFRMLISVPVGILAGMMFYVIQYDYGWETSVLWLIFGGLFGAFLCHGIIEAFYNGDIKKCLSHKLQMLITMVLAATIPLAFLFDIFGYDSYLPKKKDIKSMAVISNELRFGGSFYDEEGYISPTNYALENMKVTDIDAMYALAEILSEDAGKNRTERFFGSHYFGTISSGVVYGSDEEKQLSTDFLIRYTLKDGSEEIRLYEYNYYAVLDLLEQIYNNNEYKSAVHPVFSLLKEDYEIKFITVYAPANGMGLGIDLFPEVILEAYEEDLLAMTFDDLKNSAPIGELDVQFLVKEEDSSYEDRVNFLVYPEMTRTLELLKEKRFSMHMQGVQEANTISSITMTYGGNYRSLLSMAGLDIPEMSEENYKEYYEEFYVLDEEYYEKYGYYPETTVEPEYYQDVVVEFTDPAEIEEIKKHLIYRQYSSEFGPFPVCESGVNVEVYFEINAVEGVYGWTEQFRFAEGEIPQFVIDRLLQEFKGE